MSHKKVNSSKRNVDANYNDMPEFEVDHLDILGKASPDFGRDSESSSICPLLTPSPTGGDYQNADPLSQALEQKMLLEVKSPSPDLTQNEETALLAASPLASYTHPLDPLRNLAFDSNINSCSIEAGIGGFSSQVADINELPYDELDDSNSRDGNLIDNFHPHSRTSFSGVVLESSVSSTGLGLPENVSSNQLLRNHYQLFDGSDLISQENSKSAPLELSGRKPLPDYCFLSWNWPLIRKSCFWSIISAMIACLCVIFGMLSITPRRCYPRHGWHQGTVFYEIFTASYQDSDNDGIGDFRGLASRADYLSKLGIRAVRLNSIFSADHYPEGFGKANNLTDIEKSLGNLKDFRYLKRVLERRNISIILDLPIYPYVKNIGDVKVSIKRKNVADKIINAVHNHRSHRSLGNGSHSSRGLSKMEFTDRKKYLKPYIDGGIAGLMKSTSDHLNSISRSVVEEAIEFWFENGADGIYLKGLENYVADPKFLTEMRKWKTIKESFWKMGERKILMCDYKVLSSVTDEEIVEAILTTIELLDVYLDVSNGTLHIKAEVDKYQQSRLLDKRNYPWIHWNIGNVETKRLAGRVENNFGAILFEFLLPGTISIFYGDEMGLTEIHDPYMDHHDVRNVHHLAPMKWRPNGTGFTRHDSLPWLPFAKSVRTNDIHEQILSNMTSLRSNAPSIYMNSIWKEGESLSNTALRFVDRNIIVLERSYPRRNSYVVVYNAGSDEANNDLSGLYYRGELLEDSRGRNGIYMNFNDFKLESGEAFVVKLDK